MRKNKPDPTDAPPVDAPFPWTKAREQAAAHVAADLLTEKEIAEKSGIAERTLRLWKSHPTFAARVNELVDEFRRSIRARGIAILENRVAALNDRWRRLANIIEERAASPDMAAVPGGGTGLLVHDIKMVGSGVTAEKVDLYAVDAALLKEMREHERQAAQELGQWEERLAHQHTGAGGGAVKVEYDLAKLTKEDWLAIRAIRERSKPE